MNFKTVSIVCLFALSVQLSLTHGAAAGNETYDCLQHPECAAEEYSLYIMVGNMTFCCYEGDAITFSAKSANLNFSQSAYMHLGEEKNKTITKRSADKQPDNSTYTYGCVCSPIDPERLINVEGNFAVTIRYLRYQMEKTREYMSRLWRKYTFF